MRSSLSVKVTVKADLAAMLFRAALLLMLFMA